MLKDPHSDEIREENAEIRRLDRRVLVRGGRLSPRKNLILLLRKLIKENLSSINYLHVCNTND